MRIRLASAALAIVGAVGALYTARVAAARIEGNPDPFPRGRLTAEPDGEEVFISRPDGTVLRAMVAGDGPTVILTHGYCLTLGQWNIVWDELVSRGHGSSHSTNVVTGAPRSALLVSGLSR